MFKQLILIVGALLRCLVAPTHGWALRHANPPPVELRQCPKHTPCQGSSAICDVAGTFSQARFGQDTTDPTDAQILKVYKLRYETHLGAPRGGQLQLAEVLEHIAAHKPWGQRAVHQGEPRA